MNRIITLIKDVRWSMIIIVFLLFVLAHLVTPMLTEILNDRAANAPVVKMGGILTARNDDMVTIALIGEKLRECEFVKMNAFTVINGEMHDSNLIGPDSPVRGTRPVGIYNLGEWRVWPTNGAEKVMIFVHHSCNGKTVFTKIADVNL